MTPAQKIRQSVARSSLVRAVIEVLDSRRLLSASIGDTEEHDHDHGGQIVPAEVNTWAPISVSLTKPGKYLTPAKKGDPAQLVRNYLAGTTSKLKTTRTAVTTAEVTDLYTDSMSGLTHVYFRQTYNGLPVLNSVANGSVDGSGRLIAAATGFVRPGPVTKAIVKESEAPAVSAVDAVDHVAEELGIELSGGAGVAPFLGEKIRVSAPGLQDQPIETNLVYVARGQTKVELAWRMVVELEDGSHWYELAVSASTGEVIFATDYVSHATYNVYALPTEAPNDGVRTLVTDPHDPTASPFGWHDTNGVVGPEFTTTRGNNVHTYLDTDNSNSPDATTLDGGAGLNFNPGLDLTQSPSTLTNQQAALANLFYLNNRIHDITYQYGFTEVAGNFQSNNYGRGGSGNDAVNAEAQDGGGVNNANFGTPADGSAPRMQMYLWNRTTPGRDGDLDGLIVIHEYTHGISNRLTGGPSNAGALSAVQSGGMGEGWSDFLSLMLTQKPGDTATTSVGVGTYAIGQATTGVGIRRFPYNTNMSISPLTIGSFNSTQSVHRTGEVWCNALWDLNWALINRYGPTADLGAGYTNESSGGSAMTFQLVMDAMKIQPANPSLFQARDAILQADLNLTGGANQTLIWQTFARRGFGFSATTASSASTSLVEAFDIPSPFPSVNASSLNQSTVVPVTGISVKFTKSMNPESFSLAEDLVSLTGPGAINLKPAVSAATWSDSNRTLTLALPTQTSLGNYAMVLGPKITSADNGLQIDQDADGVGGTLTDNITVNVTYNPFIGPDAFGYTAGAAFFEPLDLVAGAPGVVDTGLSSDDSSTSINIGSNTFNFYGTVYSGTQLFPNTNGLITFGSGTNAYSNTDLTTSPTQASIAVLWDDWRTDVNSADRVLYKLEDTTGDGTADRAIIEWSDVINYDFPSSPGTFQAILELNTGTRPGTITLNYTDAIVGGSGGDNGASSTVGIKTVGAAGSNRLLAALNDPASPLIGSGKAIRVGLDIVAPDVTSAKASNDRFVQVTMQLSEPIRTPLVSAFTLVNRTTNVSTSLSAASVSINPVTNELTLATGTKIEPGRYRLTVAAGALQDTLGNRNLVPDVLDMTIGQKADGPRLAARGLPAFTTTPGTTSIFDRQVRFAGFFGEQKVGPLVSVD